MQKAKMIFDSANEDLNGYASIHIPDHRMKQNSVGTLYAFIDSKLYGK